MKNLRAFIYGCRTLAAVVALLAIMTAFTLLSSQNPSSSKAGWLQQSHSFIGLAKPKMPKRPGIAPTIKPA